MVSEIVEQDLKTIVDTIKDDAKVLEGKTILISGGSGFIGKYLVATIYHLNKNIFSNPCKVISVDNYITGSESNIINLDGDKNFEFIKHDVRVPLNISQNIDYIIHAAGIGSPIYYRKYPIETIEVGTIGTKNMLELAREKNVKGFLFFSSSEIYGDPDHKFVPTPETYRGNVSCTGPRSCYDESKRLGETLCVNYFQIYNVPIKVVRPFNIYGPGMRLDDYRVLPNFFANAFNGKPLPIYGSGDHTRTFCYITDAIAGFLKVLLIGKNGEAYNVGNSNDEISVIDLAKIIVNLFGGNAQIQKINNQDEAYASADPKRRCPDITKIKSELNYNPTINVNSGLEKLFRWYKEEYKFN